MENADNMTRGRPVDGAGPLETLRLRVRAGGPDRLTGGFTCQQTVVA